MKTILTMNANTKYLNVNYAKKINNKSMKLLKLNIKNMFKTAFFRVFNAKNVIFKFSRFNQLFTSKKIVAFQNNSVSFAIKFFIKIKKKNMVWKIVIKARPNNFSLSFRMILSKLKKLSKTNKKN